MDWIIYGIWFACGFICREVIMRNQIRRARKLFELSVDDLRKQIDKIELVETEIKNENKTNL
jgi:hypothetical protein